MSSSFGGVDERLLLLERELNQETVELEQRAGAFVECVQAVKEDGQSIANCGDAVEFLLNSRIMKVDEMDVSLLKEILTFLVAELNVEQSGDVVWNQLAHLVSKGLVLPTSCKAVELDRVSLHEVVNQQKQELFTLWQQLRVKLKAWYSFVLHALPNCSSDDTIIDKIINLERQRLVQRLCLLYQPGDTLQWYSEMRKHQLESHSRKLRQHCVSGVEHAKYFSEWIVVARGMIREDLVLLQDGDLMGAARLKPAEFLERSYLCVVTDEVKRVLALLLSLVGVQESELTLCDVLTFSALITACQQFDRFVFRIVMLTRFVSSENVSHEERYAIETYPVDVRAVKRGELPAQHSDDELGEEKIVDFVWEWSAGFESYVSIVVQQMEMVMLSSVQHFVAEEEASYVATGRLPFVCLTVDSVDCKSSDTPKKVTKCCQSIVEIIKSVMCIVTAGNSAAFMSAVSTFTGILDKVLAPYMDHTSKSASAVPEHMAVYNLCLLVSSTAYLATVLHECHVMVKVHSSSPRVATVYQKAHNLYHCLTQQLIKYHVNVCATIVLQDAESNYYRDPKPFYEDERSSFSIQMWNYYLQGLKYDFWMTFSPCFAKLAISNILVEGLSILSGRYSEAEVSEARNRQYRTDIVAILSIASSFVWAACDATDLIAYQTAATEWTETSTPSLVSLIWNHCNKLVTCLVNQSTTATSKTKPVANRDWLEIVEPQLFAQERSVSNLLRGCVKAKWLLEQPAVSRHELLELLTMNECIIPKTLCQSSTCTAEELLTSLWDILLLPSESQTSLSRPSIIDLVRLSTTSQGNSRLFETWLVSKLTHLVVKDAVCLSVFLLCRKATESNMESKLFSSPSSQVPSRFQTYLPANDPINLVSAVSTCLVQVFNKLRTNVCSLPSALIYSLKQLDVESTLNVETIYISCCQEALRELSKAKIITDSPGYQVVIAEMESQVEALKGNDSKPNCGNKVIACLREVVGEIRSLQDSGLALCNSCRIRDDLLIKKNHEAEQVWISMLQKNAADVMNLLQASAGVVSLPHLQAKRNEGDVASTGCLNSTASSCCFEQFHPLQSFNCIGGMMYSQGALQNATGILLDDLQN